MRPTPVENIYKACTRIIQVIKVFLPICCDINRREILSIFNGEDHEQDPDVRVRYAHNHKRDHVHGQVRGHEQVHVHEKVHVHKQVHVHEQDRVRIQDHVHEPRVRHGRREIQPQMLVRERGQLLEQHELRVQLVLHDAQLEQLVQHKDLQRLRQRGHCVQYQVRSF